MIVMKTFKTLAIILLVNAAAMLFNIQGCSNPVEPQPVTVCDTTYNELMPPIYTPRDSVRKHTDTIVECRDTILDKI